MSHMSVFLSMTVCYFTSLIWFLALSALIYLILICLISFSNCSWKKWNYRGMWQLTSSQRWKKLVPVWYGMSMLIKFILYFILYLHFFDLIWLILLKGQTWKCITFSLLNGCVHATVQNSAEMSLSKMSPQSNIIQTPPAFLGNSPIKDYFYCVFALLDKS